MLRDVLLFLKQDENAQQKVHGTVVCYIELRKEGCTGKTKGPSPAFYPVLGSGQCQIPAKESKK